MPPGCQASSPTTASASAEPPTESSRGTSFTMAISLTKGQTVSLKKNGGGTLTHVRMGLGWDAFKKKGFFGGMKSQSIDLDASAVLYDSNRNVVDQVWFQQLQSKDRSVQHSGDNLTGDGEGDDESITVYLDQVP